MNNRTGFDPVGGPDRFDQMLSRFDPSLDRNTFSKFMLSSDSPEDIALQLRVKALVVSARQKCPDAER
jgi:hypothetical protein